MAEVKLLKIRPQGYTPDLIPSEIKPPAWTLVQNMLTQDGYLVDYPADTAAQTTGVDRHTPLFLLSAPQQSGAAASSPYVLASGFNGSAGELIAVNCVVPNDFDITPATWTKVAAGLTSGCILNRQPVINNTADDPCTWDFNTGNIATTIPGWPASTKCYGTIRAFQEFLVAVNISASGYGQDSVLWSDRGTAANALPTSWTASATNEAGDATLGDTPGALIDSLSLGTDHILYKERSCYIMQQTGLPEVMTIRQLPLQFGAVSRNAVLQLNGLHYLVTCDDIVKHDGRSAVSIATGKIRNTLFDAHDLNPLKARQTFIVYKPDTSDIIIGYSSNAKTYCDKALFYNLEREIWSAREIGDAATQAGTYMDGDTGCPHIAAVPAAFTGTVDRRTDLLTCNPGSTDQEGRIGRMLNNSTNVRVPFKAECTGLELEPGHYTQVSRVWVVGQNLEDMTLTVGTSNSPDEAVTWGSGLTFDASATGQYVDVNTVAARYLSIRLEGDGSATGTARQKIAGFDIEYNRAGRF